jgi:hypothetical protein
VSAPHRSSDVPLTRLPGNLAEDPIGVVEVDGVWWRTETNGHLVIAP